MNRRQRGRKKIARERWWISGESEAERKKKDRERERKKRGSRERDKVRASMVFWSLMKSVFMKMSSY